MSLTNLFINIVKDNSNLLEDKYIRKWYLLAKTMYKDFKTKENSFQERKIKNYKMCNFYNKNFSWK